MPLPSHVKTPWPPKPLRGLLRDVAEADAWYSGDVDRLRGFYGSGSGPTLPKAADQPERSGLGQRVKFWQRRSRDTNTQSRQQLHVPLAGEIAETAADLLLSDEPELRTPGATDVTESGQPAFPDAVATQARLEDLAHDADLHNALHEAAEVAAAHGGVYLRAAWDPDVADHPLLTAVHADAAAPEFAYGRLTAVTFWRTLESDGKDVWRHLERHERGVILHGLYVGTVDEVGRRIDLADHPATAELDDEVALPAGLRLAVAYWPHVRPSRKHRATPHGRSAWQGAEGLLDALDEVWTSWQRDIRLGQARIITREDALERSSGRGRGAWFDPDREVYVGLDLEPSADGKPFMEAVQFEIRVEQHERSALSLVERIVSTCGYSPQTFGLHIEGRAESGTALRVREAKTVRTRGRQQRYAARPIADIVEALLVIDREVFGSNVEPARPAISWADSLSDDPRETAQTVQLLDAAGAASTRVRVKMAQPHLEGAELEAEVERIRAERGMAVPDPTTLGGAS